MFEGLDLTGVSGLGVASLVLALMFRTLWRLPGEWNRLLEAERSSTEEARRDATVARREAAEARIDATEARNEAHRARVATAQCERAHRVTQRKMQVLVEHLRMAGVPVPRDLFEDE